MAEPATVERAVILACRAPSYHNTQPWRWVAGAGALNLYVDRDRLAATDIGGRQALISCGATLDHLRVAMAAAGHETLVDYYPDPADHGHVARLTFKALDHITDQQSRRADAILSRRTDRLPFGPPPGLAGLEAVLLAAVAERAAVDVVGEGKRAELVEASALTDAMRLYDTSYHAEMNWWTAPYEVSDGIPYSALVSAAESDRVPVGRTFPVTQHTERRVTIGDDQSMIVVISARTDDAVGIVRSGEALSAILLEATAAGLASCTLTHLTEVPATSDVVAAITGRAFPQVLVRLGTAPVLDEVPPPTPRRPLAEVLQYHVS